MNKKKGRNNEKQLLRKITNLSIDEIEEDYYDFYQELVSEEKVGKPTVTNNNEENEDDR